MSAPQVTSSSAPAARGRRWLRRLLWSLSLLLLTICALLGAAWWWMGQADSLQRTLERVAQWLPAEQKLEAQGVQGTLRHGGQIDWLRWSSPTMQVEVKQAHISWSLPPLLSRTLRFGQVQLASLRIHSTPGPKDDSPTTPPQSLTLPVRIDLPLRVDQFIWEGSPAIELQALQAHYRYTGEQHALDLDSLRYADGSYQAQLRLQATAPMQLQASLHGELRTTLPQQPDKPLQLSAQADIHGTLATEAARLSISAKAHAPEAAGADVSAVIAPWSPQVLEQADVQLRHINTAWFMPGGPTTDLNGQLQAGPQDQGWQLQAQFQNLLPGPWDQQALPVRTLSASAHFDGAQQWTLEQARIDLGAQGNAHIQAKGQFNSGSQVFEGQADLVDISPVQLYSSLDAAPLHGRLQAHRNAEQQVQFSVDVRSAPARRAPSLSLGSLYAEGSWQAPELEVRQLSLQALQATVHSPALHINTDTQQLQGKLDIALPGSQARLDLNASPSEGKGAVDVDIRDASRLLAWLTQLPGMSAPLAGASVQGQAHAQLQWQGGWAALQQRLQNPSAARQASGLQLQAQLHIPTLRYQAPDDSTSSLSGVQLGLAGSPEALRIDLDGNAQIGPQHIQLQTKATVGLRNTPDSHALDWQASLTQLVLQWRNPQDQAAWKAQLAQPLQLRQITSGNPVLTTQFKLDAGQLQVTPPMDASVQTAGLEWEPVTLRRTGTGGWTIQSKGRLQHLPLMWVDTLNPDHPPLASIGMSGDLVLQGAWDIDNTGRKVRAHALLERASGDIRFTAEEHNASNVTIIRSTGASSRSAATNQVQSRAFAPGRGVRARIQTMRVQLDVQGNDIRTQLDWSTERAGQIQAQINSQIRHTPEGISWPDTAPLSGSIHAALPNIGVWAFFAPPGWRATGSFDTQLTLSGTRKAPDWRGEIQADNLSLQSLLDGVDLKDGRFRAQLRGSRLDITELLLHGGEGSSTRIIGQSGNLTEAPQSGGTLTATGFIDYDPLAPEDSTGLRMDVRAVADHLQVLVRADRQLSISGNLQAALHEGQFQLGGDLTVDRAAIILADDSAPSLGSDVHITSAATRKAEQEHAAKAAAQAGSVQTSKPPQLNVRLNLGKDFALQGYGITTRLGGAITVTEGPRITGEIYTINGRYRAWGQMLDVEQGTIRFNGPYANPAVDIVAIRPNVDIRVGIKVTGSVNNPRVTLFSDPEMSDAEKLSWIILGRGASGGGAEAALLQQAALALLSGGGNSGNFASQLGFDEIGFRGPSDDGSKEAALTVGKRLSKDLYVTYEQSLSGAMGTLYIFYDLSRRLTLRAQTGEQSAIDLIYTKTGD